MIVNHMNDVKAFASPSIISEYIEIFHRMIDKKGKKQLESNVLNQFIDSLSIVQDSNTIHISRDVDDDKFLDCACNCKAVYIVSGDNDLLNIGSFEGIKIIKVNEFLKIIRNDI